jgi:hypothetical protein
MRMTEEWDVKTIRGPDSWMFIYMVLGFALSIEGTILQMIPFQFPYNLFLYVALMAGTFWLFNCNAWFHGKLIGIKGRYENKAVKLGLSNGTVQFTLNILDIKRERLWEFFQQSSSLAK